MTRQTRDPGMVEQLRQAIRASGLSLGELGRAAGVSPGQLSRFLRGERNLILPAAARVCAALNLRLVGPVAPVPRPPRRRPGRPPKARPAAGKPRGRRAKGE